jgi:hypothetical protein
MEDFWLAKIFPKMSYPVSNKKTVYLKISIDYVEKLKLHCLITYYTLSVSLDSKLNKFIRMKGFLIRASNSKYLSEFFL